MFKGSFFNLGELKDCIIKCPPSYDIKRSYTNEDIEEGELDSERYMYLLLRNLKMRGQGDTGCVNLLDYTSNYIVIEAFKDNIAYFLNPASDKRVIELIAQNLIKALQALHSCEIVHNDLKIENIVFKEQHGMSLILAAQSCM